MKKLVYITLMAIASSLAFSSCTEEEIKPNISLNGGGVGVDPK